MNLSCYFAVPSPNNYVVAICTGAQSGSYSGVNFGPCERSAQLPELHDGHFAGAIARAQACDAGGNVGLLFTREWYQFDAPSDGRQAALDILPRAAQHHLA